MQSHSRITQQRKHLYYTVFQKNQAPKLWQQLCQILTDFKNSFTGRLSRKFAIQRYVDIPPYLKYATKFTIYYQFTKTTNHNILLSNILTKVSVAYRCLLCNTTASPYSKHSPLAGIWLRQ